MKWKSVIVTLAEVAPCLKMILCHAGNLPWQHFEDEAKIVVLVLAVSPKSS
jgi:hypothetical protein